MRHFNSGKIFAIGQNNIPYLQDFKENYILQQKEKEMKEANAANAAGGLMKRTFFTKKIEPSLDSSFNASEKNKKGTRSV